jgi:hypothetical protein
VVGATNFAVFVITNQVRLLWILAASVILLRQGRRRPVTARRTAAPFS